MSVPHLNRDASADPAAAAPRQEFTALRVMSPAGWVSAPGPAPPGWVSVPLHESVLLLAVAVLVAAVGEALLDAAGTPRTHTAGSVPEEIWQTCGGCLAATSNLA